ncbi:MAG TPA: LptF/LptG family permease [Thermoanaerobaculia bacterium]|nr:LptF/LptG family permease [Thermoanaerobaculia bacterium]
MPSMRLVSRSLLREIWPPFLLGFAAYTFLLLVRTIFLLTDFFVRRSATAGEVLWMVLLSIPWIVVLTIPMAFLLAVLVGVGRLSAESELVALRSCGVGPGAVYRPVLAAGAVLAVGVFVIYNVVLPRTNDLLTETMARMAATSLVNLVSPRTFRQPRPGVTLFFDRVGPDGRSLEGVFLKVGEEDAAADRDQIIVAKRGALHLEEDRLWLDLESSTVHELSPSSPSRYRVSWNRTQRILFAGDVARDSRARVSYEKGLRAQSFAELLRSAAKARTESPERYRLARVEIQKKLAIPLACLAFGLVGIPLAETSRRGGRGSSFALSLAILVGYYVLLSGGETWAQNGSLSPELAMWLPNLGLAALGLSLLRGLGREKAKWRIPGWLRRRRTAAAPAADRPRRARLGGFLRFPALLDRYVLGRFLGVFALVLLSVLLISAIVDYADQVDEILRNHPPADVLSGYYRNFLLGIGNQAAPFVILVATLLALGSLSRHAEDTACRASGVSLHRLGVPILLFGFLASAGAFWLGETVLPLASQREDRFRNIIRGRPADFVRSAAERDWHYDGSGRIWHHEEGPPGVSALLSPSVFALSPDFRLVSRTAARQADWNGKAWTFRQGWERSFDGARETGYTAFLDREVNGDPPRTFLAETRTPAQMRFRELQRYTRRLGATGYPTESLETALAERLSRPMLLPLMALLALPFAFRLGRSGALAGIGVGIGLGMVLTVLVELFGRLGAVGALPPQLAAWTPDILFATAAAFLLLKMRT